MKSKYNKTEAIVCEFNAKEIVWKLLISLLNQPELAHNRLTLIEFFFKNEHEKVTHTIENNRKGINF